MNDMIKQIIKKNAQDLVGKKHMVSLDVLKEKVQTLPKAKGFYGALQSGYEKKGVGLITEIKLASPTEKQLGSVTQILDRVKVYERAGSDAISIVTEKYFFHGDKKFIQEIKDTVALPVLQKDFIVDLYQIYEARESGADALLLIVKLLDKKTLKEFVDICISVGLEPVVEVNDDEDLEKALQTNTRIIAVNARDLDTFTIDVEKACTLLKKIPERYFKLGFSGIQSQKEVAQYKKAGAKGVLVGTSLMKAENVGECINSLRMSS